MKITGILAALGALLHISRIDAKTIAGDFYLSRDNTSAYISKFGCGVGRCKFEFRLRLHPSEQKKTKKSEAQRRAAVGLPVYLDEDWQARSFQSKPDCERTRVSRSKKSANVPLDGSWSDTVEGSLSQWIRPHVWYFTADDCKGELRKVLDKNAPIRLQYTATFISEGSHFSYEQQVAIPSAGIHLVAYGVVLLFMAFRQVREMKREGRIHSMVSALNLAMLIQIFGTASWLCHLIRYSYDGKGLVVLDGFSNVLNMTSQLIVGGLLISIGYGYSLNTEKPVESKQMLTNAFSLAGIVHLFLLLTDKYRSDWRYAFHSHEGWIGWTLVLLRMLLYWLFWSGCKRSTADNPSLSIRSFLRKYAACTVTACIMSYTTTCTILHTLYQHCVSRNIRFFFASSLFFLAYPVVHTLTCIFAPYLRYRVQTNGIFAMQLAAYIWLAKLFLTRGDYFKDSACCTLPQT